MMKPKRLMAGDTIGLIAPCCAAEDGCMEAPAAALEKLGYRVRLGAHLYDRDFTYAASIEKRAADFHAMTADDEVKMVFFGGGEVSNELLPYLDFELVRRRPKIYCSYSDGTTLLNAVTTLTGLTTFYGSNPGVCSGKELYGIRSLMAAVRDGAAPYAFEKSGPWTTLRGGECAGELIGGFLANFALILGGNYLRVDKTKKYLLFLEDHEMFGSPGVTAKYLAHLEQSGFLNNVSGLIFGHYAEREYPELTELLQRLAGRYGIPAVKTDDFGHGAFRGVLPVGACAVLDADAQTLQIVENVVEA